MTVYGCNMIRDDREEFVERVKAIDPIFKRGDLDAFWPMLHALMSMAPDRVDLAKKKSHYLASLAVRSLARGEAGAALEFLDYADRILNPRAIGSRPMKPFGRNPPPSARPSPTGESPRLSRRGVAGLRVPSLGNRSI